MIPTSLKCDLASTRAMSHWKLKRAMVVPVVSMALNLVGIVFAEQHF